MKKLLIVLAIPAAVSCSPITPSSSKLTGATSTLLESSSSSGTAELSRAPKASKIKVLSPIYISETEYLKKLSRFLSKKEGEISIIDKEQEDIFLKEGRFEISNETKKSNEIEQILFVVSDDIAKNDQVTKEEVLINITSEKDDLRLQLISPSLDSTDPVIGARADRLLHNIEKILIKYKAN